MAKRRKRPRSAAPRSGQGGQGANLQDVNAVMSTIAGDLAMAGARRGESRRTAWKSRDEQQRRRRAPTPAEGAASPASPARRACVGSLLPTKMRSPTGWEAVLRGHPDPAAARRERIPWLSSVADKVRAEKQAAEQQQQAQQQERHADVRRRLRGVALSSGVVAADAKARRSAEEMAREEEERRQRELARYRKRGRHRS